MAGKQVTLFGTNEPVASHQSEFQDPNPCVRWFGLGPEGRKCKDCKHLICFAYSKNYYKCDQRRITSGAATDHRIRWNACAKFEEVVRDGPP